MLPAQDSHSRCCEGWTEVGTLSLQEPRKSRSFPTWRDSQGISSPNRRRWHGNAAMCVQPPNKPMKRSPTRWADPVASAMACGTLRSRIYSIRAYSVPWSNRTLARILRIRADVRPGAGEYDWEGDGRWTWPRRHAYLHQEHTIVSVEIVRREDAAQQAVANGVAAVNSRRIKTPAWRRPRCLTRRSRQRQPMRLHHCGLLRRYRTSLSADLDAKPGSPFLNDRPTPDARS